jgi:regulator of protease activity HflC (stomatin/prohibitin superfamily)
MERPASIERACGCERGAEPPSERERGWGPASIEEVLMIRERENEGLPGLPMLLALLAVCGLCVWRIVAGAIGESDATLLLWALLLLLAIFLLAGLFVVNPNEGRVLQLFGDYRGTARVPGLRWANPFYTKKRISQRVRNFESARLKVNDIEGNPIEIAAVVVWQVVDTAEAVFEVDDYNNYVKVQSEAALRNLTTSYPYDAHDDTQMSLRGHTLAVADHLKKEIQERLARAGVQVIEARISHLAYAPEIAASMLQRQQAGAIIAARTRIVEGAVGMVEMALELLSRRDIVELDNERKAAMVSNLLVVLCGERSTQPIVNAGTIY